MQKPGFIFPVLLAAFLGLAPLAGRAGAEDDPLTAWKHWKDISSAIQIRPLDGPEDILEKTEIIEDRRDQLTRERERLKDAREKKSARVESRENQRDILRELEALGRGMDLESRQHLLDLTEEIQQEQSQIRELDDSIEEISREIGRSQQLASQYRDKARHLKQEEEKTNGK